MASSDAYEALIHGGAAWEEYLATHHDGRVDLTFAEFSGIDLQRRCIARCDLSAARMDNVNLDGSSVSDSVLSGVNLSDSSLVGCTFERIRATGLHLDGATIRGSVIALSDMTDVSGVFLRLHDTEVRDSTFTAVRLPDSTLRHVTCTRSCFRRVVGARTSILSCIMTLCELSEWLIELPEVVDCAFVECKVSDVEFREGRLIDSRISRSYLRRFQTQSTVVKTLDLGGTVVAETDVRAIGPDTAMLLDTAFALCKWPDQRGVVHILGAYSPSAHLLSQPIHDVRGVPPLIRREAADAQFLVRLLGDAHGWSRILLRIWGATSGYGKSLSRLTLASVLLVLCHAFALLAERGQLFGIHPRPMLLASAFWETLLVFLGVGDLKNANGWTDLIFLSVRVSGFLALGVWITIAATKVSRLGSE